jgi:hypothetical protein
MKDFQASMPIFWPATVQELLPPQAHALLAKQKQKLQRDWAAVSAAYPSLGQDEYTHFWLLVSTRTFYYTPPNLPTEETPIADECLAIVPFGDYFNHTSAPSKGCKVNYSPSGYEFILESTAAPGDELYISYGSHNNDFLLVEYGFTLPDNEHTDLILDSLLLDLFTAEQKRTLEAADYLGTYTLNSNAQGPDDLVCYRTTTALRLLCMPLRKWRRGLTNGFDEADSYQTQVVNMVRKALKTGTDSANRALHQARALGDERSNEKRVLLERWEQILAQFKAAQGKIA